MIDEGTPLWQASAVANLQKARKTNGRLGSKKSRAGCVTCKIRRVKCDEAKPSCKRCLSTNRVCEGYSDISPRAKDLSPISAAVSQTSTLGLKQSELQVFDYFLSLAGPRLSGGLDQDFWGGRVLQLCHDQPYVRDAVLAISTLYRHPQYLQRFSVNFEGDHELPNSERIKLLKTGDPFGNHRIDENHAVALKYYNRAIAAFKKQLEAGNATPLQAVLSCMLFMNIEMMRDSVLDAIDLFTQSVKLMRQTLATADPDDILVKWLKQAFTRVGVLAATFGHPQSMSIPPEHVDIQEQEAFPNLNVARTALFAVMADSHTFIRDATDYKQSVLAGEEEEIALLEKHAARKSSLAWPDTIDVQDEDSRRSEYVVAQETIRSAHVIDNELSGFPSSPRSGRKTGVLIEQPAPNIPSLPATRKSDDSTARAKRKDWLNTLIDQDDHHIYQLSQWHKSFSPLAQSQSSTHPEVVSMMYIWYHVSDLWLKTRLDHTQMNFEGYTWHFEQVLHHAEIYVRHIEAQDIVFTMETGVVPQLYLTATKCRVPSLRRRALELLKRGPRKESIWGAASTWELAATLAWFEERGLGLPSPFESFDLATWLPEWDLRLPPENQRVHNLQIMKNLIHLRFDVEITTIETDVDGRRQQVVFEVPIGSQCLSKDVKEGERDVYHGPGGVGSFIGPRGAGLAGHGEAVFKESGFAASRSAEARFAESVSVDGRLPESMLYD